VSYLSASAVVIHYEEALYQVYAPLPLPSVTVPHHRLTPRRLKVGVYNLLNMIGVE